MITAKITFKRKKDPTRTSNMQKISDIHYGEASERLYIRVDQPSRVITWKMVIMPSTMLSKVMIPYMMSAESGTPSAAKVMPYVLGDPQV